MRYLNGTFYLYAHLDVSSGIVHAKSSNLWGPYTEPVNASFTGNGWLIDADTFLDEDGQLYYYETNRQGGSGHEIRARTMSPHHERSFDAEWFMGSPDSG
jgi:beta-xylosidase